MPTPAELDRLLGVLPRTDRVPFALAALASARRQELLSLDWPHCDLDLGQLVLADAGDYARSAAANGVVAVVALLALLLEQEREARGRPPAGLVRRRRRSRSRPGGCRSRRSTRAATPSGRATA
jgi:hypothetical protein